MKILIVGSDLNSLLLAKYIKSQNEEHDIYVTTTDVSAPETYTGIRIRENDVNSISPNAAFANASTLGCNIVYAFT